MTPPVLTREQVRRVDAFAIERYGMSGLVLMENAGCGAVGALLAFDPSLSSVSPKLPKEPSSSDDVQVAGLLRGSGAAPLQPANRLSAPPEGVALRLGGSGLRRDPPLVVILCGKGNNAGDGFVMARHLEIRGVACRVLLLAPAEQLVGDARANFNILRHADMPIIDVSAGPINELLDQHAGGAAWLVDALLGTGATGEPREPFAAAIRWMNAKSARRMAVDLPSGLDCDTGVPAAATVRANLTATLVAAKPGLFGVEAKPYLGEVRIIDIGVPPRLVREATAV